MDFGFTPKIPGCARKIAEVKFSTTRFFTEEKANKMSEDVDAKDVQVDFESDSVLDARNDDAVAVREDVKAMALGVDTGDNIPANATQVKSARAVVGNLNIGIKQHLVVEKAMFISTRSRVTWVLSTPDSPSVEVELTHGTISGHRKVCFRSI